MSDDDYATEWQMDLQAIRPEPVPVADEQSKLEADEFELYAKTERFKAEITAAQISNAERDANMRARRGYARYIFGLLVAWVVAIMATVLGSGHERCPIKLSDPVLIALITGVSINIIGLFAIVASYLFPKA